MTEVHRRDAIGGFLEPDVLLVERPTQKELVPAEADRARRADQPDEVMPRVLRGG